MDKGIFAKNTERMFNCVLPDLDTSDKLLRELDSKELEDVKQKLVSQLITRKVLNKFRIFGLYCLHFMGT